MAAHVDRPASYFLFQETFEEQLETSPDPSPPHWSRPQKLRQTDVSEHERHPRHAGMLSEEQGMLGKHSAEHGGDANVSVLPRTGSKCHQQLRRIVKEHQFVRQSNGPGTTVPMGIPAGTTATVGQRSDDNSWIKVYDKSQTTARQQLRKTVIQIRVWVMQDEAVAVSRSSCYSVTSSPTCV